MKTIIMLIVLVLSCLATKAQTPNANELFAQKKTQRKYLIQQNALLRTYLKFLKKGYEIVDKGLSVIGDIKDAAFTRDADYFNSLRQVNPVVKNSPKVGDIFLYQQAIISGFQQLRTDCSNSHEFTRDEIDYIDSVYANMLTACSISVDELTLVTTAGVAEMKDDQRLLRLDKIHADMQDKYAFTLDFINSTQLLALQRAKERTQIESLLKLHQEF